MDAIGTCWANWVARMDFGSGEAMGGYVDSFLRNRGDAARLVCSGAGAAISDKLCSGASSFVSVVAAVLGRGDDMGLSDARYVVEKMLSRSSSWGRSNDDCQRLSLGAIGAVLERPVWESLRGVTAGAGGS